MKYIDKYVLNDQQILEAIRARIEGEFDNRYLQMFGMLSTDSLADIRDIIKIALREEAI